MPSNSNMSCAPNGLPPQVLTLAERECYCLRSLRSYEAKFTGQRWKEGGETKITTPPLSTQQQFLWEITTDRVHLVLMRRITISKHHVFLCHAEPSSEHVTKPNSENETEKRNCIPIKFPITIAPAFNKEQAYRNSSHDNGPKKTPGIVSWKSCFPGMLKIFITCPLYKSNQEFENQGTLPADGL